MKIWQICDIGNLIEKNFKLILNLKNKKHIQVTQMNSLHSNWRPHLIGQFSIIFSVYEGYNNITFIQAVSAI